MTLKDIQEDTDKWTGQFTPQYWSPHEMLAALAEETGEVAREINHLYGPKKKKEGEQNEHGKKLGQELAEVIFTVACMANSREINLQEEWEHMMQERHYGRDKDRFTKKE